MILGLLHTTIRSDEKLILEAAIKRHVTLKFLDVREQIFNPQTFIPSFDIALERCVSTIKGSYATRFLESLGVMVVNSSHIATVCEDKFLTSLALQKAGIPTPAFALAFTLKQAEKAVEELGGYPVVIKPNLGSWGRLLAKVNDIDALEAIIEHKEVLGSPHQKTFYIQQFIKKPGRDIRIHVIGGKVTSAIYRQSSHWITNTARGATPLACSIDKDLESIAKKVGDAIGEGILGIDILETDGGYLVNEVNHTMEFQNVQRVTGIDVAGKIVEYCQALLKK